MTRHPGSTSEFTIDMVDDMERGNWSRALVGSANGTVFHDLDFLDYHPSERFDFHHLMVRQGVEVVSLIPGALSDRPDGTWFLSPQGASVGGPTVRKKASIGEVMGIVATVQRYAREAGLTGVRMSIPPSPYSLPASEAVPFALAAQGFELEESLYCHFLDVSKDEGAIGYSKTRRYEIRKALASGVVPQERDLGALGTFYDILEASLQRFGAKPTHTEEELSDLFTRLPSRVRLFMSSKNGEDTAGIVLFGVTSSVANSFYICERPDKRGDSATSVLISHIAGVLLQEGFRFLDLGPSSHAGYSLNHGVARFKESFGATGFCRETWSWRTEDSG